MLSHPLTDRTQKEDIIIAYDTVLTYEIGLNNKSIFRVWNELVTCVVFTDVKIGILIYNTLQVVPTILCYVYSYIVLICLLPYYTLIMT